MIQLKNVSKYYYSKGMISSGISRVNLDFNIGEFVVITGESGSGKSTLLNVISGLDSYEEGEMYINGIETSHYIASDFEEYRKKYIGNIFQEFNLVNSYTVYQNIELILLINGYSREEIKKKVPEIIEKVGLTSHAKAKVSKLSGGQKQRVAIARALAKDTDIIVADEPTGNLDSVSAEGIASLLSEIAKDKLVIVVTHNHEQFEKYATRQIKMHDGKVIEDKALNADSERKQASGQDMKDALSVKAKPISAGGKIRLGIRNTFNILPKFMLMLIVFLFIVFSVTSQYTTLKHQQAEENKLGFNDYFMNYSEKRIIVKKTDGSAFGVNDYIAMSNVANVESVVLDDIMLDNSMYIEDGDAAYEAYPLLIDDFSGKLAAGRMPEATNEAVLMSYENEYYFDEESIENLLNKTYYVAFGEDKELGITIVGCAYKKASDEYDAMMYTGNLYVTGEMMSIMREELYNQNSTITAIMNGKEQEYQPGNPFYRVIPNQNVAAGTALVSEEINNYYGKDGAKDQVIAIRADNMYYSETVELEVADTYNKKTFTSKTGIEEYELHNGTIYINQSDYDRLFKKDNYQASVYVKDAEKIDKTIAAMNNMGYVSMPLKDTLINFTEGLGSIVRVPMAIILTLAIFFIAYFVTSLVLRSRAKYFTILRMLGMARKNMRRILDVEMIFIVNIAFGIFLGTVALVKEGIIKSGYIIELIQYMNTVDYVILYVVTLVMAYFISGKFAKRLFKKTAMNTFREEER